MLLNRNPRYTQGIFSPRNPEKFLGDKAIYRSGLELKFFHFCDLNPNVLKWGSENVVIPYVNKLDGRVHRYFVDNLVVIKEGDKTKKYLIEIKPHSQTLEPVIKKGMKQKTIIFEQTRYIQNQCKWEAAREFCRGRDFEFRIITDLDLKPQKK
jgi:hypothetical protein